MGKRRNCGQIPIYPWHDTLSAYSTARHPGLLLPAALVVLVQPAADENLGIGAAQFFYLFTISKIKVAAAILLVYTCPVFVALYAAIFRHQKLTRNSVLALLGTLLGCYLVVGAYNLDLLALNRSGIIGGMMGAITFAIYTLLGEYGMQKYSPWTVLLYGLLFAALTWNILHPPIEAFFEGINRIRSTHASITATLEPITAGVISALFLGELLEPLQIFGGLLVIASIILLQMKSNPEQGPTERPG